MARCFTNIDFHKNNIPFYEYDIEKSVVGYDQYRAIDGCDGGRCVLVLMVSRKITILYSSQFSKNSQKIINYNNRSVSCIYSINTAYLY
jgi:hypothetical protein